MEEFKRIKGRFQQKGKTEAEWYLDVYDEQGNLRENPFIPLKDEIIIFEKDNAGNNENRIKVGDGETNVMDLPFAGAKYVADDKLLVLNGTQFTTNIIHKGEVDNSFEIFDGEAKAVYAIASGTKDKEPIKGILGDIGANQISVNNPVAKATGSIALGGGAEANSSGGQALGVLTTAGVKGYYWDEIDFTNKTITITSTRRTSTLFKPTAANDLDWQIGDTISLVNDNQYPACAKITAINGNKITVDNLPFTSSSYKSILTAYTYVSPDDRTIFACYQKEEANFTIDVLNISIINKRWYPRAGEIELGWAGTAIGVENFVSGSVGFVSGFNNWQAGNFGATFGRENIGGYYGLTSGGWNENKGWHSGVIGRDLVNKGNYNFLTGRASEVITGVCNTVSGYDNTVTSGESNVVGGETNTVGGNYNIVSGKTNEVSGSRNSVNGLENRAEDTYDSLISGTHNVLRHCDSSFAIGNYLTSSGGNCQLIVGKSNNDIDNALLVIGNGTSDGSSRSNAMAVTTFGNVIIGNGNVESASGKSKKVLAVGANLNIGEETYNSIVTGYNSNNTDYIVYNTESSIIAGDNIKVNSFNRSIIGGYNITADSNKDSSNSSIIMGTSINIDDKLLHNSAVIGENTVLTRYGAVNESLILSSNSTIDSAVTNSIILSTNATVENSTNNIISAYYSEGTNKKLNAIAESIITGAGHNINTANDIAVFGLSHTVLKETDADGTPASLLIAGDNNNSRYYSTFLLGNHLKAKCAEQTILGRYNAESEGFLVIGNGTADAPSNVFTVNRNGTVTVGSNPVNYYDVATKGYVDSHGGGSVNEDAVKEIVEGMLLSGAW